MTSVTKFRDYRKLLKHELKKRCETDGRYSLRSFARDLSVASSQLSEVLNGKKGLSRDTARGIAIKLGYDDDEAEYFSDLVESVHARSEVMRNIATKKIDEKSKNLNEKGRKLDSDIFNAFSDWHHFAILELTRIKNFKGTPEWIAAELGISEAKAADSIARLERLKLIVKKGDRFLPTDEVLVAPVEDPEVLGGKFHKQILLKAVDAVSEQPLEEREFNTVLLAIDSSKLEYARKRIVKFRDRLCEELTAGDNACTDKVYAFAMQFFKITK